MLSNPRVSQKQMKTQISKNLSSLHNNQLIQNLKSNLVESKRRQEQEKKIYINLSLNQNLCINFEEQKNKGLNRLRTLINKVNNKSQIVNTKSNI